MFKGTMNWVGVVWTLRDPAECHYEFVEQAPSRNTILQLQELTISQATSGLVCYDMHRKLLIDWLNSAILLLTLAC